ncbi:cytochrome c [Hymenobacter sp. ASUV-10]|uniref:Cytochrome c n=1 Tax=Hymenobacter aranciens TaxID=3063996 RepID=A0ABT9BBK0_9BACT|nr:cytochrome c [Hymenobacter sp. ASUV-10]MDO7875645.1 cytochrome c [Hymenobacter sp. ASUV-10]
MATNSTGFALSAGMAAIVVLLGYTLLNAVSLVGFASQPAAKHDVTETPSDTVAGWCGTPSLYPSRAILSAADAAVVDAGDALFKGNCAQCHAVNDKVVGPALAGITRRRPIAWLIPWVKNSSKMVAGGDAYAVKLFEEYQKQQMPSFNLTDEEIMAIIAYVASQEGGMAIASAEGVVVD